MEKDVSGKEDIEKVVYLFYEKVKTDEAIGFFFSEVIQVDWEKHLAIMTAFWENALFYTGEYEGTPINAHRKMKRIHAVQPGHFSRWLQLFNQTVDELFAGPNADKMKEHAEAIAEIIRQKM